METDKDAIAPGTVAIAGVVAICHELADAGLLDKAAIGRISLFMRTASEKSKASPELQTTLRLAIADHFALLLRKFEPDS